MCRILLSLCPHNLILHIIIQKEKESVIPYKKRENYNNDGDYGKYVKSTLKPGMKVRAIDDYKSIIMGDIGIFKQSKFFGPHAQFEWAWLGGRPVGSIGIWWRFFLHPQKLVCFTFNIVVDLCTLTEFFEKLYRKHEGIEDAQ